MAEGRKIVVSVTMGTAMHQDLKHCGNVSAAVRDAVDKWLREQQQK